MNDVFILCGDSNEVGQNWKPTVGGSVYSTYYSPTYAKSSQIKSLPQPWDGTNPISSTPGAGTFAAATNGQGANPVHSHPLCGVGSAMSMANSYITTKGDSSLNVGLVGCAWPGSMLTTTSGAGEWPTWLPQYNYGSPYGMMVARANAAKAWGTLRVLCITLGVNDANISSDLYPLFGPDLRGLISCFRADVQMPDLPVLVTAMGPTNGSAQWANISNWINSIAGVQKNVVVVTRSNVDVVATGDPHFTVGSNEAFGPVKSTALIALQ